MLQYRLSGDRPDNRQADAFAKTLVGDRKGRRLGNIRMPQRQRFDRDGIDIVAATDDHILETTLDSEIAALVKNPEIAGQKPTVSVEALFGRGLVIKIAEHQCRAAAGDLSDRSWRNLAIWIERIEQTHLVSRAPATAGLDDRCLIVIGMRVLVRRTLCHAVDILRLDTLPDERLAHRGRDRRTSHIEQ